jgi:hypothetical protein
LAALFFASNDLEIEAVDVGNMMTVLSNLGVTNIGPENMAERMAAATDSMMSGFFHLITNKRRFDESKFSPLFTSIFSSDIPCFDEWAKVEIFDSHFKFNATVTSD